MGCSRPSGHSGTRPRPSVGNVQARHARRRDKARMRRNPMRPATTAAQAIGDTHHATDAVLQPIHDATATAGALLAVDSTAATPVLTRPLALGADIVMHSATKYLNGHSDVIAGSLTCARADEFWQRIVGARSSSGAILGSFEAFLLLRGMRTLYPRVE